MQEPEILAQLLERAKSLEASGDAKGAEETYRRIISTNSSHSGASFP
jgi:hypothetical protein